MATNTLEFTLKDGSSQILDLSVLANILYVYIILTVKGKIKDFLKGITALDGPAIYLHRYENVFLASALRLDQRLCERSYRSVGIRPKRLSSGYGTSRLFGVSSST